jgi:hypothetical protein
VNAKTEDGEGDPRNVESRGGVEKVEVAFDAG